MNAKSAQLKTAASIAAALTLTAAGGVSALFLTFGQDPSPVTATAPETVVVTEYVDQFGNPVTPGVVAPGALSAAVAPEIIVVTPDGTPVVRTDVPAPPTAPGEPPMEAVYEEEEYEEGEEYEEEEVGEYEAAEGYVDHEDEDEHDEEEDDD